MTNISSETELVSQTEATSAGSVHTDQDIHKVYEQIDKRALQRLLTLCIEDMQAHGQVLHLDTNEELPRLIPVLQAYFSREELQQLLGKKLAAKLLDMHRAEVLQNLYLELEVQKVLHAFTEANIPLMLFKGPALAYTAYPDHHMRTYHDLDTLIQPEDLPRAHDILTGLGYTFYEEFRANVINDKRSGYNYILRTDSWLEVLIELHTAPHESEIGTGFDVAALWQRAQSVTVLGESVLTMNPVDHLLYLCWHYRFHGFTRLLWLYDLVVLLRTHLTAMDWDDLIQTAQRQQQATTLYYCLAWCRDLFEVEIPPSVFTHLQPPVLPRLLVERVALPDVAKALATVHGQSRRTLAHRVMVDSNAELLLAGFRTFFPTPAAMGQRYMEHSRLPLQLYFLFYLVHPWITLGKGIRYLFTAIRSKKKALRPTGAE